LTEATASNHLMYLAAGDRVLIFPKDGADKRPVGMITQGVAAAYGLFVDRDGALYVCSEGNHVDVYRRGELTPSFTYSAELNRSRLACQVPRQACNSGAIADISSFRRETASTSQTIRLCRVLCGRPARGC